MITEKLRTIFLISIPVFIAHGIEEYITGLYTIDSHVHAMFGYFATLPSPQAVFLLFQIMLWFTLIISYLLLLGEKWRFRLMFIPGFVFIYELHHLYKALVVGRYYPGLMTAFVLYIVGYFYWKELIRTLNQKILN